MENGKSDKGTFDDKKWQWMINFYSILQMKENGFTHSSEMLFWGFNLVQIDMVDELRTIFDLYSDRWLIEVARGGEYAFDIPKSVYDKIQWLVDKNVSFALFFLFTLRTFLEKKKEFILIYWKCYKQNKNKRVNIC